jgi:hypothetical protein
MTKSTRRNKKKKNQGKKEKKKKEKDLEPKRHKASFCPRGS